MNDEMHQLFKFGDLHKPGWISVTRSEVNALRLNPGLNSRQSECGEFIYLHEDDDMPAFVKARAAHHVGTPYVTIIAPLYTPCWIRALPRFSKA